MVMPHPYENNTWIIHYKVVEDGVRKFDQARFVGPLKDALKHEKTLRAIPKHELTREVVAAILGGRIHAKELKKPR